MGLNLRQHDETKNRLVDMQSTTRAIIKNRLFDEMMDCLTEDDGVGMSLRLEQLDTEFPRHPILTYFSALSRDILGDHAGAFERYNQAARCASTKLTDGADSRLRETASKSFAWIADYYREEGKLNAAMDMARMAIAVMPSAAHAWAVLSDVRKADDDAVGAVDALYESFACDNDSGFLGCIGQHCTSIHWYGEAVRVYSRAVGLAPQDPDLWIELSKAHCSQGHFSAAARAAERAIALQEEQNPWLINTYAYLLRQSGRNEESLTQAKIAVEALPDSSAAWDTLSHAYNGTQQHDEAIAAALKAIELNWGEVEAWYHLGVAYVRSNRIDKSHDILNRLKKMDFAWAGMLADELLGRAERRTIRSRP